MIGTLPESATSPYQAAVEITRSTTPRPSCGAREPALRERPRRIYKQLYLIKRPDHRTNDALQHTTVHLLHLHARIVLTENHHVGHFLPSITTNTRPSGFTHRIFLVVLARLIKLTSKRVRKYLHLWQHLRVAPVANP